jgi:hypothetical protein
LTFLLSNEEVALFTFLGVEPSGLFFSFGVSDLGRAPLSFHPLLNTVLNLIDYLCFKIPKVGLGKLFDQVYR